MTMGERGRAEDIEIPGIAQFSEPSKLPLGRF